MVDLLRHGAVAGEGWAFRGGGTDVPLADAGWEQMEQVAALLPWDRIDGVACSPMQRCRLPAQRFANRHQRPCEVLPAMREMDFGRWEGRSWAELAPRYRPELERFWDDPQSVTPPQGEPFDAFARRVWQGWQAWMAQGSGHRLLIAHGGVIRVILARLLQMPTAALWRLDIPYGSWSRVSLLAGHPPRLLFLNPHAGGGR